MKQQRMRFRLLTLLTIVLLLTAAGYGVYSVSFYGSRWVSSARNTRYRNAKSSVIPGDIYDRNGVVIAGADENGNRTFQSDVWARSSLVHLIGDNDGNVANGLDSFQANYLLGFETSLSERISDLLSGKTRKGDSITVTVDSKLSAYIVDQWLQNSKTRTKCGAVVVLNYQTGEVLSLVSLPVYDPMNVTDEIKNSSTHPFWNRAMQSTLPPGSTFKIITAASALQNLADAQTRIYTCTGATQVDDRTITDYGMASHGELTLARAFRVSCNNVFAQTALLVGDQALRKTAESFGFNDNFLFRDLVVENSAYPTKNRTNLEIAWSGDGQSQVAATPLHMCMVSAAIANGGVMMEPRLISRVESPSGVVRLRFAQKEYRTACTPQVASTLATFMKDVVKNGTGTKAAVDGLTIAGKTGSAEGNVNGRAVTHAWFTGYIESSQYPYAVCVMVEEGGSGGSVAAPIAQKIFTYLAR